MTTPAARPRRALPWIGGALTAALLAGGATTVMLIRDHPQGEPIAAPAPTVSPSSTMSVEMLVECATIRRAFYAWATTSVPPDAEGLQAMTEVDMIRLQKLAGALADATTGYADRSAKVLAVAAAAYNAAVSRLNVERTLGGHGDQPGKVSAETAEVLSVADGQLRADAAMFLGPCPPGA